LHKPVASDHISIGLKLANLWSNPIKLVSNALTKLTMPTLTT